MLNIPPPRIDRWYHDEESEQSFTVIDLDSDEGIIEICYSDGEIADLSLDDWTEISPVEIDQPEDWPWPTDELGTGDPDYDES